MSTASAEPTAGLTGSHFSFTGTFSRDDETRYFNFAVATAGTVTFRTYSYAGGVNAEGTTIPSGGFDPTLSLFDSEGNLIATNQDGGCSAVAQEAVSKFCWDSYLVAQLPVGSYQLVLSQGDNSANGPTLADSFVFAGQGNFTVADPTSTGFYDDGGIQRTGNYAVDITGSASNAVAQLLISSQTPPSGKVPQAYSYQFTQSGGTAPFTWSVAGGAANLPPGLALSAAGVLSGTPTLYGTYDFSVTITDSQATPATSTAAFEVVIIPQDLGISTASPLSNWVTGVAFSTNLTPVGGYLPLTWSLAGTPTPASLGGLSLSTGGKLSGTPSATGTFTIPVQVTDAHGTVVSKQLAWTVRTPAMITGFSPPPGIVGRGYGGFPFGATGGANPLTWSLAGGNLPGNMSVTPAGVLQGTPASGGSFAFTVQATDGVKPVTQAVTLNVYGVLSIAPDSLPDAIGNQPYEASVTATGGSGRATLSASGLPPGLNMSVSGAISGTPIKAGTFNFTVTASDGASGQGASKSYTMNVAFPDLVIVSATDLGGVAAGNPLQRSVLAKGGYPPYTWAATGLPDGFSMDSTGRVNGSTKTPGSYSFKATVTDSQPVSTSVTLAFTVLGITATPSVTAAKTTTVYTGTFSAAGGTPPYTWTATGVPGGMQLSSAGVLSGTPKATGRPLLAVKVTDSKGVSAETSFTLDITAPASLTISRSPLIDATVEEPYSDTVAASGGTLPYTWSLQGGRLPSGLTLGTDGSIAGTPKDFGTYDFTLAVRDKDGTAASAKFTLNVKAAALKVSAATLPNGVVGSEYPDQVFSLTGGIGPYSYAITKGSLPSGLTLSSNKLSGVPDTVGTFPFTLTVTDSLKTTVNLQLSITVKPANADLILSSTSIAFTLATPATTLPSGSNVTIRSSVVQQLINYKTAVTPAVPWLDLSSVGSTTPGSLSIQLNSAALDLAPSTTPYTATVVVSCAAPSLCAGNSQNVAVSLTVTSSVPKLSVATALLAFTATTGSPVAGGQSFTVQNSGGGTVNIASVTASAQWIQLSGSPKSLTAGASAAVQVVVDASSISPGFYQATIVVSSDAGTATVPVTVNYAANGTMTLAPSGRQFQQPAGSSPGNPNGSFLILPEGKLSIGAQATLGTSTGGAWLRLGTSNIVATLSTPGRVEYSVDPAVASGLDVGTYNSTILVTSPDVTDSPQTFTAFLNVTPATVLVRPDPQPAGFDYTSSGSATKKTQTVTVFSSSKTAIPFQSSASTVNGGNWLSVSPSSGTSSVSSPGTTTVTLDPSGLPAGTYRGGVSYAFSSAAVRTVNVTLIVAAGAAPRLEVLESATPTPRDATCVATTLVATQTGLVNNFAQPTAWPTALSVKVSDNCGNAVPGGQVVAIFSNLDPALPLRPIDSSSGIYSGTWTPRSTASQVTVDARVSAPGFPTATTQIQGQIVPNAAPVLTPHGTVHAFAPAVGAPLGPGSIVAIYGENLSAQPTSATTLPLPKALGGTEVIIGGIKSPMYYVSSGQVNAQIPYELEGGKKYEVVISANGALTVPESINVVDTTPGVAAYASGLIIAQHLDGSLLSETAPAAPGELVIFYLAGMGDTDVNVPTGAAAPLDQLVHPIVPPTVTLDGKTAPVAFAGLTPGLVGLYQINFQIPADAVDGDLTMVISQRASKSNQTVVPVKKPTN